MWGFHSSEFIQEWSESLFHARSKISGNWGGGLLYVLTISVGSVFLNAFLIFFMVYLMGFVLSWYFKYLSDINASLELSSFPSILFEKPTHTSVVSFWHSVTDVLKLWEAWGLQLRASEMYNFSNDCPLCHIAWVFYFSCRLSPFFPPTAFLRRKSPSISDKQLLVLQPLSANPQTQCLLLLLLESIRPGFARIPSRSQNPHKTSLHTCFFPSSL